MVADQVERILTDVDLLKQSRRDLLSSAGRLS
jgi:hypothetical protein